MRKNKKRFVEEKKRTKVNGKAVVLFSFFVSSVYA